MLHWAWIDCVGSCYEPVGYGAAFSKEHTNVGLWLGHTTATTQKKPAPKAGPMASDDVQDAAGALLPPCMPVIELTDHAAVCANFIEYNHSLLSKRKRCDDMQTEDGAVVSPRSSTADCNRP
jgi:hypothetical protein